MIGYIQYLVFFGIIVLSIAIFSTLMGDDTCGGVLGLIVGVVLGWWVITEWDKSEKREHDIENGGKAEDKIIPDIGQKPNSYSVIYQYGHKGIDHYLQMYAKHKELPGTLIFTDSGLNFYSFETRTEQKFSISWDEIQGASEYTRGNFYSQKSGLHIKNTKYGLVSLVADDASTIVGLITYRLARHQEKIKRQEQLIETQIQARNLDAIPPSSFENLISQLFHSMGYYVKQVGRTGDEGVDLVCKDSDGYEIIVQCKRYRGKVGAPTVRDFYGALTHRRAKKGYIVTTGEFTEPAQKWVSGKPIELIDRIRLAELLNRYQPNTRGSK